jgi:acylpyruvate hydrolase
MKIFCIGRNYAEHARELGNAIPTEPLVFMKPPTALLKSPCDFYMPDFSDNVQHEIELVLRISKNGKHIAEKFAHKYYDHIGIGIDFTARDLQNKLKDKGSPWEIAKAFDGSAPIGEFMPLANFADLSNIDFSMTRNGQTVQQGNTRDLIFSFDVLVSYLSRYFTLQQGDLIYTGTPEGVGKVAIGDDLRGYINGQELLQCTVK